MRYKNKECASCKLKGERNKFQVCGIITLLTFAFYFLTLQVSAQTSTNAIGGDISGNGGSVSYSVGQVVYSTEIGATGYVVEGVQQPYEISVVNGIDVEEINLSVSAYPNPTNDYLQLKVESEKFKELSYQLYDTNGKLLQSEKITNDKTTIVMSNLVPAIYFIKVIQENKELKTFKIIKK